MTHDSRYSRSALCPWVRADVGSNQDGQRALDQAVEQPLGRPGPHPDVGYYVGCSALPEP